MTALDPQAWLEFVKKLERAKAELFDAWQHMDGIEPMSVQGESALATAQNAIDTLYLCEAMLYHDGEPPAWEWESENDLVVEGVPDTIRDRALVLIRRAEACRDR